MTSFSADFNIPLTIRLNNKINKIPNVEPISSSGVSEFKIINNGNIQKKIENIPNEANEPDIEWILFIFLLFSFPFTNVSLLLKCLFSLYFHNDGVNKIKNCWIVRKIQIFVSKNEIKCELVGIKLLFSTDENEENRGKIVDIEKFGGIGNKEKYEGRKLFNEGNNSGIKFKFHWNGIKFHWICINSRWNFNWPANSPRKYGKI